QAEDGIRYRNVTGVQTCALPIFRSFRYYILGTGYDMVPKTPEWAAPITLIPADKIRELAEKIGTTKPVYICQGYGSQRHANGEKIGRASCRESVGSLRRDAATHR